MSTVANKKSSPNKIKLQKQFTFGPESELPDTADNSFDDIFNEEETRSLSNPGNFADLVKQTPFRKLKSEEISISKSL